ncbi:MAG TPA: CDP-alcohol phosphatidyltransferase family protein [Verrucomicrobiales bacterium]|nr:CDP-alcohol phosphatidyltransferase family protein [Verrucomicrobiales bacterium]
MSDDLAARRPLKSRSTRWAGGLSRFLLRLGCRPNQVSVMSTVFALGGGACMILAARTGTGIWWLGAALGIQLRLLCNLMDGMLAVEGGLKSPAGDLYNEFPDRLSDAALLMAFGYAGAFNPWSPVLGGIAAAGALMTACIRMHGASLTGTHDFRGPMAKPQRMAVLTLACLLLIAFPQWDVIFWTLALITIGCALTCLRRLRALAAVLHARSKP